MKTIKLEIAPDLITEMLTTGYTHNSFVISKGLPEGAEFSGIYTNNQGNIEIVFIVEGEQEIVRENIEITTIRSF